MISFITSIMDIQGWIKHRVNSRVFKNRETHASHSTSLSNSIQIACVLWQGLTRILRHRLLSSKLITTTYCTKCSNFSNHENGVPTQVSLLIFLIPCQNISIFISKLSLYIVQYASINPMDYRLICPFYQIGFHRIVIII